MGVEDQVFPQAVGGDVEGGQGGDREVGILVGPGEGVGGGLEFGVGDRVGEVADAAVEVESELGGEGGGVGAEAVLVAALGEGD